MSTSNQRAALHKTRTQSSAGFCVRENMTKKYTTIKRQLGILEYKHGLAMTPDDREKAKHLLTFYGYQEVITKHIDTLSLGDPEHIIYDNYVTIDTIERLFDFDFTLRNIIRSAAERFELTFKAALIDAVSLEYGVKRSEYLDTLKFRVGRINSKGRSSRDYLFYKIDEAIEFSKEDLRPWEIINRLTLGTIATYYKLSETAVKNRVIAKMLRSQFRNDFDDVIVKNLFSDLIYLMQNFRNRASHGGRLYDYAPSGKNEGFKNAEKIFTYIQPNDTQYSSSGLFPLMVATSALNNLDPSKIMSVINAEIEDIKEFELTLFYYFLEVMNYPIDFWRETTD